MSEEPTSQIKDRIVEIKRVKGRDLEANARNWRTHPETQRKAMQGVLNEIGMAGSLVAYYSDRNDGALTLIDGELRTELDEEAEWPVIITDLNDEEADKLLSAFDPVAYLAGVDREKQHEVMMDALAGIDDLHMRELVDGALRDLGGDEDEEDDTQGDSDDDEEAREGPPQMALQPMEHYDYISLFFKSHWDFQRAIELLEIRKEALDIPATFGRSKATRKVGLGRVVAGPEAIDRLAEKSGGQRQFSMVEEQEALTDQGPDILEVLRQVEDVLSRVAEADEMTDELQEETAGTLEFFREVIL